jgi:hypothetical protein
MHIHQVTILCMSVCDIRRTVFILELKINFCDEFPDTESVNNENQVHLFYCHQGECLNIPNHILFFSYVCYQ